MGEIYWIMAREHQADLAREAAKLARAAAVHTTPWWTRGIRTLLEMRKPRSCVLADVIEHGRETAPTTRRHRGRELRA